MTRQTVLAVANVQHRKSLRAHVQPDCTKKRYAIKPGLIVCVRGKNPPTVMTTETRPRLDLDEEQVEPGSTKRKRQRKQHKLRKSRSGTETLQEMSAGQTSDATSSVETLNVLTRTRNSLLYQSMQLENPPTSSSELTSLPAMSWMRFAKDLYDGRIEQICILLDLERMMSEVEELRQLHAASTTESEDTLSAKTKKERFDGQSWDS
ncbi:hypothetical protein Pcac1_g24464 [Phytophthora cactorum]|nr:hypothetical protein Pcac1_g24464 [Phytophthora cactorum]KAG2847495.1 hypothetical protein PC112_g1056 [Phytophthora cactorum]KAG2934059.1 hypothetical protein PC114_g1166 [Phytophthora cactorum]KAG3183210.1 hypothetical protein C6341_g5599 [Phytophthora cactorum]